MFYISSVLLMGPQLMQQLILMEQSNMSPAWSPDYEQKIYNTVKVFLLLQVISWILVVGHLLDTCLGTCLNIALLC